MKIFRSHYRHAFTRVEAIVVFAVAGLLLVLCLALLAEKQRRDGIHCVSCLVQIGLAAEIWRGDNNDKYPMEVSVALGGAQELLATGNVAACFQVMSNELATPRILICPRDATRSYATNFGNTLTRANISYFIGINPGGTDRGLLFSGDANLVQGGRPVPSGIINLQTNTAVWSPERYSRSGHILTAGVLVRSVTQIGFGSDAANNAVAIP
jgi:hypothetical protein